MTLIIINVKLVRHIYVVFLLMTLKMYLNFAESECNGLSPNFVPILSEFKRINQLLFHKKSLENLFFSDDFGESRS